MGYVDIINFQHTSIVHLYSSIVLTNSISFDGCMFELTWYNFHTMMNPYVKQIKSEYCHSFLCYHIRRILSYFYLASISLVQCCFGRVLFSYKYFGQCFSYSRMTCCFFPFCLGPFTLGPLLVTVRKLDCMYLTYILL